MEPSSILKRLNEGGLIRALAVYAGASWLVIQVVLALRDLLRLPDWIGPATLILLLIGLVVVLATVWIQAHPLTTAREQAGELPRDWELGVGDLLRSLRAGRLPHLNWVRVVTGGVVALSLLFGVAGAYVVFQDRGSAFRAGLAEASEAGVGVAVLPFEVSGAVGDALLGEGLMDLLATNIDALAGLRAIAPASVVARNVSAGDEAGVLELARSLRAGYVVTGRVTNVGDRLRVQAVVRDARTGRRLGPPQQAEGAADQLLTLVDQLSIGVAALMLERDPEYATTFRPSLSLTSSPVALRAFLEGEALFRRLEFPQAIAAYERALQEDSTFALAWARKGTAVGWQENLGSARPWMETALRHADRLPERDRLLLEGISAVTGFDYSKRPLIEVATHRYPDDAALWNVLAEFHVHHGQEVLVPVSTAYEAVLQAVRLQPDFYPHYIHAIELAVLLEDTVRAVELFAASAERLDSGTATELRLLMDLAYGSPDAKRRAAAALEAPDHGVTTLEVGLSLPRLLEHKERLMRARRALPAASGRTTRILFTTLMVRGRFQEALAMVHDDPLVAPAARVPFAFMLYMQDAAAPPAGWDSHLGLANVDSANTAALLFSAAYAADRGDWAEHVRAIQHMRTQERLRTASDDTAAARTDRLRIAAAEGYASWRRGRLADARRLLVGVIPDIGWGHGKYVRWWLAELLNEMGADDEALRYYASLRRDGDFNEFPLRHLRMAQIHERNGRLTEARAALVDLLEIWKDADTGHPPLMAARERLTRLAGR